MVNLGDLFPRLTADITTDFMFGESIYLLKQPACFQSDFTRAFHEAEVGGENRWRLGRLARLFPQHKFYKDVKEVHRYIDSYINRAIASRELLNSQQSPEGEMKTKQHYTFFSEIYKVTNNTQTLREHLLIIFFAGRNTTAGLLSDLFFMLARRPSVWNKIRAEVAELHGGKPTFEQLQSMKYTRCCLNESRFSYLPHLYSQSASA